MSAHDLAQRGEVGRAAGGGVEDGGDFAEVVGAEDAGGDDRKRLGVEAGSLLMREGGTRETVVGETATVLPLKSNT